MSCQTTPSGQSDGVWRHGDACVIVRFRLTPKSSKDAIDGLVDTPEGPAFQARVRALPEDGKANAALEQLVSRWLDVPRSRIGLVAGGRSRLKAMKIDGQSEELSRRLQDRVDALKGNQAADDAVSARQTK